MKKTAASDSAAGVDVGLSAEVDEAEKLGSDLEDPELNSLGEDLDKALGALE